MAAMQGFFFSGGFITVLFFMLYAYISNMSYVCKTYIQENKCTIFTKCDVLFTFLFVFLVTYADYEKLGVCITSLRSIKSQHGCRFARLRNITSWVSQVDWCFFQTTAEARIELHPPCRLPVKIWMSSMMTPFIDLSSWTSVSWPPR
jgi:hypothetical protein